MRWFTSSRGENQDTGALKACLKALEALNAVVQDQGKSITTLESNERMLKLEWQDVLDRMNRVMGRLTARIRKTEASESSESDDLEVPKAPAPDTQATGTHSLLQNARSRRGLLSG